MFINRPCVGIYRLPVFIFSPCSGTVLIIIYVTHHQDTVFILIFLGIGEIIWPVFFASVETNQVSVFVIALGRIIISSVAVLLQKYSGDTPASIRKRSFNDLRKLTKRVPLAVVINLFAVVFVPFVRETILSK